MKMIARIICRQQAFGMLRIAHDLVEIDHGVKMPGGANPIIDGSPVSLVGGGRMIVGRTSKRQDGSADHFDVISVRARHNLLVCRKNSPDQNIMLRARDVAFASQHANVIDSFEHNQIPDARLRNHIAVQPRQRIRPQAIRKQMVPANALIENGVVARGGPRLKAFCQHVRPTVVPIGRGAVPVGDRVSRTTIALASCEAATSIPETKYQCSTVLAPANSSAETRSPWATYDVAREPGCPVCSTG